MPFNILVNLKVTTKEFVEGVNKAQSALTRFNVYVGRLASDFRRLGIDMFLLGTALRYTFGRDLEKSIKIMMDVDDALQNIKAILNLNAEQVSNLNSLITRLGKTSKFFQKDIAEASVQLARAGWQYDRIITALKILPSLATALRTDMITASKLMISGMEAFRNSLGKTNNEMELAVKVANLYARATASARIEAQDLAAFMRLGASAVAGLNLDAKESIAIFGAINQVMGNGARAAYAFNQAVNYLMRLPVRERLRREILPKLRAVGLTLDDINIKTQGVAKAMFNLNKAIGTDYALAAKIFGVRGLRAYNLLTKMEERYKEIRKRLDEANDVFKMSAIIMRSVLNQWVLVLSAIEATRRKMGLLLKEELIKAFKYIRDMLKLFDKWLDLHKETFVWLVKTGAKIVVISVLLSTIPFILSIIMRLAIFVKSVVETILRVALVKGSLVSKLLTRVIILLRRFDVKLLRISRATIFLLNSASSLIEAKIIRNISRIGYILRQISIGIRGLRLAWLARFVNRYLSVNRYYNILRFLEKVFYKVKLGFNSMIGAITVIRRSGFGLISMFKPRNLEGFINMVKAYGRFVARARDLRPLDRILRQYKVLGERAAELLLKGIDRQAKGLVVRTVPSVFNLKDRVKLQYIIPRKDIKIFIDLLEAVYKRLLSISKIVSKVNKIIKDTVTDLKNIRSFFVGIYKRIVENTKSILTFIRVSLREIYDFSLAIVSIWVRPELLKRLSIVYKDLLFFRRVLFEIGGIVKTSYNNFMETTKAVKASMVDLFGLIINRVNYIGRYIHYIIRYYSRLKVWDEIFMSMFKRALQFIKAKYPMYLSMLIKRLKSGAANAFKIILYTITAGVGRAIRTIVNLINRGVIPFINFIGTKVVQTIGKTLYYISGISREIVSLIRKTLIGGMKIVVFQVRTIFRGLKGVLSILQGVWKIFHGILASSFIWAMITGFFRLIVENLKKTENKLAGFKRIIKYIWFALRPIILAFQLLEEVLIIFISTLFGTIHGIVIAIKEALGYTGEMAKGWEGVGDWLENAVKSLQRFSKHLIWLTNLATAIVLDILDKTSDFSWRWFKDIFYRIYKMFVEFLKMIAKGILSFIKWVNVIVVEFVADIILFALKKVGFVALVRFLLREIEKVMEGLAYLFEVKGWGKWADKMNLAAKELKDFIRSIKENEELFTFENIVKQAKANWKSLGKELSNNAKTFAEAFKTQGKTLISDFENLITRGKRASKIYKHFTDIVKGEGRRAKLVVTVPKTEEERLTQINKYVEVLRYKAQIETNKLNRSLVEARRVYLSILREIGKAGGFEKAPAKMKEEYEKAKNKIVDLNEKIKQTNELLNKQLNILIFKDVKDKIAKYEKSVSDLVTQKQRWSAVMEKIRNRLELVNQKIEVLKQRQRELSESGRRLSRNDERRLRRLLRYKERLIEFEMRLKDKIVVANYNIEKFNKEIERQKKKMSDETPLKRLEEIKKKIEWLEAHPPKVFGKEIDSPAYRRRITRLKEMAKVLKEAIGRKAAEEVARYEQRIKPAREALRNFVEDALQSGTESGKAFGKGLEKALKYGVDNALDYVRVHMKGLSKELQKEADKILKKYSKVTTGTQARGARGKVEKAEIGKGFGLDVVGFLENQGRQLEEKIRIYQHRIDMLLTYAQIWESVNPKITKYYRDLAFKLQQTVNKLSDQLLVWGGIIDISKKIKNSIVGIEGLFKNVFQNIVASARNVIGFRKLPRVPVNMNMPTTNVKEKEKWKESIINANYNVNVNTKLDAEYLGNTILNALKRDSVAGGL